MSPDRERGFALLTVVLGVAAMLVLVVAIQRVAAFQAGQAELQRRQDAVLATAEAMLERYAAKMTLDPLYYQHFVDEAEAPRACTDTGSAGYGRRVDPGDAWFEDCNTWSYADVDPQDWFRHPLLGGATPEGGAASALIRVDPPRDGGPLTVTVAARHDGFVGARVVVADIEAESVSEFVRMVEGELRYGSGARTRGKVYAGYRVGYRRGGEAYDNVYAEVTIGGWGSFGPPEWKNGAQGWDSTGRWNDAGETIRDVYPQPIDFSGFVDDLAALRTAACDGGGICLDPARDRRIPTSVRAYLLESVGSRLRISYATSVPAGRGCQSAEERWWLNSQNASWQVLETVDLPLNGALWASEHLVVGRDAARPFVLDGALTAYAGDTSRRRNIVLGADVLYADGASGSDVLGLIASDEIWINPYAVGSDRSLTLSGAFLSQNGAMKTALSCGSNGSNLTPRNSTLETFGSNASLGTGNMACCFVTRDYRFDERLERLRPPLFPLVRSEWAYTNWREIPTPEWARAGP